MCAMVMVPLDTKLSIGKVAGVQLFQGERYYFLVGSAVSYYPADVVERIYRQEYKKE